MAKIIYKSAQGDITKLNTTTPITLPSTKVITFENMTKDKLYLSLNQAFKQGIIPILYDPNISSIKPKVEALDFEKLPEETASIFFTSGTTGEPIGALKSRKNLQLELSVLLKLFASENFERIIVTVPLIHIYGFLTGVLLPNALNIDVVLKEEFLPYELLELSEGKKTLCVTNPVFLKVLNKLNISNKYKNMVFLSSTGKLESKIVKGLNEKLSCKVYQLFGSTETGGIAYKINDDELWRPLNYVKISKEDGCLQVNSPFISKFIIEKRLKEVNHPFVTSDLIELKDNKFKLLGRKSEIIKVSGKRISLLEVENLLEEHKDIDEALVKLDYKIDSHKDEQLSIQVVTTLDLISLKKEVKTILQSNYKKINIRIYIEIVDKISKNHMGKKIRK